MAHYLFEHNASHGRLMSPLQLLPLSFFCLFNPTNYCAIVLQADRHTDPQLTTSGHKGVGVLRGRRVSLINPGSVNPITHSLKGLLNHNCLAIYIQVNVALR